MNPCYKQHKLGSSFQQAQASWPDLLGRQIDETPGIDAIGRINGLKSVVRL